MYKLILMVAMQGRLYNINIKQVLMPIIKNKKRELFFSTALSRFNQSENEENSSKKSLLLSSF